MIFCEELKNINDPVRKAQITDNGKEEKNNHPRKPLNFNSRVLLF